MTYAQQVGLRIVQSRENIGLSQAELAKRSDINVSVLNRIEQGTRSVRDNELLAISNVTGVTTDFLLGKNQTPEWAEKDEVIQLDKILQSKVGMAYGPDGEISEEDREALDNLIAGYFWSKKKKEKEKK